MEFFKRKSVFALAAMFAASALFVGCGGGGGGDDTTTTEPSATWDAGQGPNASDAWATDLLEASWMKNTDGSIGFRPITSATGSGAWYYITDNAEVTNASIKEGEVSWKATLENENEDEDIWPYATMSISFEENCPELLLDASRIYLIYTADQPIYLKLGDGTDAAHDGAGYSTLLQKGTNKKVTLTKTNFSQPDWAAGDGLDYELNMGCVTEFGFDAGDNYGKTVNIKISSFWAELDWPEED